MTFRWQGLDPLHGLTLMTAPTWDPVTGFRFRNDDGSETSATWIAAENTAITLLMDTPFRLRIVSQMTNAGDTTSVAFNLQYQLEDEFGVFGLWRTPGTSGTTNAPIKRVNSASVSHGTATTRQLAAGTGTFVAGEVLGASTNFTDSKSMPASSHIENEWTLEIDSGVAVEGRRARFRVQIASTAYTQTQTVELTFGAATNPAVPPTLLSPEDEATHDGVEFTWQFNTDNAAFGVESQEAFAFRRTALTPVNWPTEIVRNTPKPAGVAGQTGVDFSPDGTMLAVAASNSLPRVAVYNTSDWSTIFSASAPFGTGEARSLRFSPDGTLLAVAGQSTPHLVIYDTNTWEPIEGTPVPGERNCVAWSPNGQLLAAGGTFGRKIAVYNTSDWSLEHEDTDTPVQTLTTMFSPDGNWLAFAGITLPRLVIKSTSTWSEASLDTDPAATVGCIDFSPNSSQLAITQSLSTERIRVYQLSSGTWVRRLSVSNPGAPTRQLRHLPGSGYLAVGVNGLSGIYVVDPNDQWFPVAFGAPTLPEEKNSTQGIGVRSSDDMIAVAHNYTGKHPSLATRLTVFKVDGGLPTDQWWNGTDWQSTSHFITSAVEAITLPAGAWDD